MTRNNKRQDVTAPKKWFAWISLLTALLSLGVAGIGVFKGYFNSREIDALHGIHDNLAKVTHSQYLAATQQAERQTAKARQQQEYIRSLEDQQKQLEQSLVKTKNAEFLRQWLLIQRKESRESWSKVELKNLYTAEAPLVPDVTVLRHIVSVKGTSIDDVGAQLEHTPSEPEYVIALLQYSILESTLRRQHVKNSMERKSNKAVEQSEPLLIDLYWKEARFNETAREAIAMGMISELTPEIRQKFPGSLEAFPKRPIYHFANETTWWTVFQDIDFRYDVTTLPEAAPRADRISD